MPIKTLLAVGVVGAAAGAAATSAYISTNRREQMPPITRSQSQSPNLHPTPTSNAVSPLPLDDRPLHASFTRQPQVLPPVDPTGLFKYGFPGPINDLRPMPSLVSSFNRVTRNPHWVAEHITPTSLSINEGNRRHSNFHEDEALPPKFRARLADYYRSGYDRGHQVPAADAKWSQTAMDATFALSNMCPQVGDGFNRDYWAHFEDFCRRLTQHYPSVRVVTGPLYLPRRDPDGKWRVSYEVIGSPPNVAVPTHFYKVIFGEDGTTGGNVSLGAFVLPNAEIDNDKPLRDFEVPVDIVERASGLEFVSKLPEARRRRLCQEVDCSLIVKEYKDRQRGVGSRSPSPSERV